ncbi:MAG: gliding motility-associated C-terminal domain-containing protein, partial [Flavobacteriales bacterium]
VFYSPLPVVDIGPDTTLCAGQTLQLDATTPSATYEWQDNSTNVTLNVSTAGVYSVDVTLNGCSTTDMINVNYNPLPIVDLGPDQTICPSADVLLDATVPGATYLWQDGALTPTYSASTPGPYSVDVTLNNCTASDTFTLSHYALQTVDLGPDVTICQGATTSLSALVPGATFVWSTAELTNSITVGDAGIYWVDATLNGCVVRDSITVFVTPLPVVDLGPDVSLCQGSTTSLIALLPGATFLWNTGEMTNSITVGTAGIYWVDATLNGCVARDSVTVSVTPLPIVDLGPDVSFCQGSTTSLNAVAPGASFLWNTGELTNSITIGIAGTYWVQTTQGGCTASDTILVSVAPAPVVDLGVDLTFCNGTTATLDATWPGATYLWSNGAVTPTITASASATYSVIVTVGNCAAYDTVVVNVITATLVDLGPDVSLCQGEDVLLDATTAGSTYLWSTGAVTPSITAATSGTYWVQAIQGSCNSTDTVVVTVLATDLIDLGADQLLCNGESSILLDATVAGATYSWNTGAVTPTLLVATSGTYAVEVTLNSCSSVDTVYIEFGTLIIDLGADTVLCPGASMVLDLGLPNGTNTWNSAEVGPSFTVLAPGTYWVEHVPLVGCSASDTIVVTYAQGDALDLGPDLQLCDGGSATLDATLPGAAYLWDNASTNALRTVSASGTYSVIATVGQCALYDTVNVVFNPLPVVEIGPDASICPGTTTTFDATTAGATYLWNDGSTGANYTSGNAVNVTVEVTLNGCTVTDNANITILDEPVVELGADSTLCEGTSLLLDVAQAGATYLWSTGSTQPTLTIDTDGTYSVDVTLNGCMVSDAIDVGIFMTSTFSIGGDVVLCPGETVVLDATQANAQHTWSTGANADAISVNGEGIYWVNVVMAGCSASDTVEVSVIDLPAPNLGADIISCEGLMVPLSVDPGDVEVLWSTGSTLSAIDVVTEGAYSVTFSLEGCTATDVINISFNDSITSLEIGPETVICPGQYMNLSVTEINGINYLWSNGSTTSNTTVDAAGIYTVTFTGQCASGTEQIEVMVGDCDTYVNVPNTFTPNNDDINDVFLPVVSGTVENYKLEIFDRWGELIFTTSDPTIGWDGSVKTTIAQDGVYVWKINYRVGNAPAANAERIIGHVTLLR